MNHYTYDSDGNLLRSTVVDVDAGTATITLAGGGTTVEVVGAEQLAVLRAEAREQAQLDRLRSNFQTLRNTPPAASLTNAQLRDEVDLLRAMLLDLARVVRGIAAE